MTSHADTFTTMTHGEFTWPYPKPLLAKPSQPPIKTGKRLFERRIDPDDCMCNVHGLQSEMNRYKTLANKERRLNDEFCKIDREMTSLVSTALDNSCGMEDEVMKSVYQTDYEKRGLPQAKYTTMIAAVDSPFGAPIQPVVTDLRDGFRDPTRFRYSAIERPTINPAKSINVLREPETFFMWEEPFTGRSEYEDTISKFGLSNMKNRQQYLQPQPSSRRRWGDSNL